MTIFLLYVISPVIVAIFIRVLTNRSLSDEKSKDYCILINGIVMALMIGLRHYGNGSSDSRFYFDVWQNISEMDFFEFFQYAKEIDMEKGFLFYNFVATRIFKNPQFAFVFSGIFFSVSTSMFVKKNCKDVVLPFVIFNSLGLFNFMVQGMRQAFAMCICLYAYELAKKKKIIGFTVVVALATTFHASAVVFAVAFAMRFLKCNIHSIIVFVAGSVVGTNILPKIFELLNKLMNEEYGISEVPVGSSRIITIMIHLVIILFGLVLYKFGNERNDYAPFIYMAILGTTMFYLSTSANAIVERIAFYFMFAQMAIVSNALYNVRDKKIKLILSMSIIGLFFCLAIHKASYSSLIPYKFMWS